MPTIALTAKIRNVSENCTLVLNSRHLLVAGLSSKVVYAMKPPIPDGLDVLLTSALPITVSGVLNGIKIPPEVLENCHITNYLIQYLRTHAESLGVNAVSDPFTAEDTGLITFLLTPLRRIPLATTSLPIHLTLTGIATTFIWHTNSEGCGEFTSQGIRSIIDPFSEHLSLPYLSLVDNAIKRFTTFQLVRRYPLIFGSWWKVCNLQRSGLLAHIDTSLQQLDQETQLIPFIFSSITHIIDRSCRPAFRDSCQRLLKSIEHNTRVRSRTTTQTLTAYLGSTGESTDSSITESIPEHAFVTTLANIYRNGTKRKSFKVSSGWVLEDRAGDNDWLDGDTHLQFESALVPQMDDMIVTSDSVSSSSLCSGRQVLSETQEIVPDTKDTSDLDFSDDAYGSDTGVFSPFIGKISGSGSSDGVSTDIYSHRKAKEQLEVERKERGLVEVPTQHE